MTGVGQVVEAEEAAESRRGGPLVSKSRLAPLDWLFPIEEAELFLELERWNVWSSFFFPSKVLTHLLLNQPTIAGAQKQSEKPLSQRYQCACHLLWDSLRAGLVLP